MSDNKNVNNKEKGFVVGGYTFKTKQEAQEAKDEMNAIKYLSGKTVKIRNRYMCCIIR